MKTRLIAASIWVLLAAGRGFAVDQNGNSQSDVWEYQYNATGLTAAADFDADGIINRDESIAGTDPKQGGSYPSIDIVPTNTPLAKWTSLRGKQYKLQVITNLTDPAWQTIATKSGTDSTLTNSMSAPFSRVVVQEMDSDTDGVSDWEEYQLQFDPTRTNTDRYAETDSSRVSKGMTNQSVVTVAVLENDISERWPDNGVFAIRRSGGLKPVTVNFTIGGTATRDTDYTMPSGTNMLVPWGTREVWIECVPVSDASDAEATETIVLTAVTGPGYVLGTNTVATIQLKNETAGSAPNPKAAARFLVQAAFGPNADDPVDGDIVPENVETVQAMGFEGWITNEFAQPVGYLQPFAEYCPSIPDMYKDAKQVSWWNRAMGVPTLAPGYPVQNPDPLRQRLTFALSQILVVSDRPETLAVNPVGLCNYYDKLMTNAFGNFRQILFDVTMHPCMGFFLSHLFNQKPDPANNIFPDENYAREVMQLFSIGLWELNQDGTRRLTNGLPIPTYDNGDITEFARVFTGLSYGGTNANTFLNAQENFLQQMKPWDAYHDLNPKTLLNGLALYARTSSVPDVGTATLLDINAAMDNLFMHTNVAPFIGKQLIQRFVTSNPGTGYVARVSAAFNNNGSGVRGDMKAVIKAVLLDPDARDPVMMSDPKFGKQREPFLRVVNVARAFNASCAAGFYELDAFILDHYEEPLKAPSVFNFYLPGYTPPGPITDNGLVGPEYQILNAGSAITVPNYWLQAAQSGLHRWGTADPTRNVKLNLTTEYAQVHDLDSVIRRLDLALMYGQLPAREFQNIKEKVERITSGVTSGWDQERIWLAVYLLVTSPEFTSMR